MWVDSNLTGVVTLVAISSCLIASAEVWGKLGSPRPESVRKLVHIGGGFACLTYPFLISDHRIVLAMAIGFAGIFLISKRLKLLNSLHSVERSTRGSEYFPIAVWLVFWISTGQPWLYVSTILVLTLADGFAAIVGTRIGRIRYKITEESEKSLEGSLAFLTVSALAIFIPLHSMTPYSWLACLYCSILVALLLTCMEAVSVRGTDNLFVPILCCFVLQRITTKPVDEMGFQVFSLTANLVVIGLVIWRTRTLNAASALILICVTYACWSLGSVAWALPILIGFLLYVFTCLSAGIRDNYKAISTGTVFAVLSIPLTILIYANGIEAYNTLYGPFVGSVIVALNLVLWETYSRSHPGVRGNIPATIVGAVGGAMMIAVLLAVLFKQWSWHLHLAYLAIVVIASVCHALLKWDHHGKEGRTWTPQRFIITGVTAVFIFAGQHFGWWPEWNLSRL